MDAELALALEEGRKKARMERSQFVRDAILEKLQSMGFEIDPEIGLAPSRAAPLPEDEKMRERFRKNVAARLAAEKNQRSRSVRSDKPART